MKNLFFLWASFEARVQVFSLETNLKKGEKLWVVNLSPHLNVLYSHTARRGVIVHEIAHVYLYPGEFDTKEAHQGADALAREWGFGDEIEALRAHWNMIERLERRNRS
jgi:hypothetical protein